MNFSSSAAEWRISGSVIHVLRFVLPEKISIVCVCVCVCVCVLWESSCQSLNPSNHKANGSSRLAGLRERLICATNFADWHRPVYSDLFCWRSSTGNRFSVFHIQAADGKLIFSISQSDSRDHETFKFYGNMNNFLCDGIKLECLFTDVCSEALTH